MASCDGSFRGSEATRLPPSAHFHCSETYGTGSAADKEGVTFRCTVTNHSESVDDAIANQNSFIFRCREPSFGVLTDNEPPVAAASTAEMHHEEEDNQNDNDDDNSDDNYNHFFLIGTAETYPYDLAKRTGFQIWPGTRILVDALLLPSSSSGGYHPRLQHWQQALRHKSGLNILELGAGVGVVGTLLAGVAGAQVLLTDLESVVKDSLVPNLIKQQNDSIPSSSPVWLQKQSSPVFPIGPGWAAATPLDWTKPLAAQLPLEQMHQIDLIIAGDCCFLSSMLHGLFDTVSAIFDAASSKDNNNNNNNNNNRLPPRLLLSLQRRDPAFFTSIDYLLAEITARSWTFECLAWYPVAKEVELAEQEESIRCNDNNNSTATSSDAIMKEVFLFEVAPATIL